MAKHRIKKSNRIDTYRAIGIIISMLLNVVLTYITRHYEIPIYLDSIGTIFISFLCNSFAGILTAVITNLICSFFSSDYMYFSLIGVLIAIVSAWFIRREKHKKKVNYIWLIFLLAFISGTLGTLIQWILLGKLEFDSVSELAKMLAGNKSSLYFISSDILLFGINVIDKGMSVVIAMIAFSLIPSDFRKKLWDGGWKQKPLSKEEIKIINSSLKKGFNTLRVRVALLLSTAIIAVALVFGFVSATMNYNSVRKHGEETVTYVSRFISELLDTQYFDYFIYDSKKVSEYEDTVYKDVNDKLYSYLNTFDTVKDIYIFKISEDGCYLIFETDDYFQENGIIGEKIKDDPVNNLLPDFLKGVEVGPQYIRTQYGSFITSYTSIYDSNGNPTQYYVGCEYSLEVFSEYLKGYIIKLIIVVSGYFMLILACGFWLSRHYLLYPICSLERSIDKIMQGIDDQDELEESVKYLQKLDIRTNDELERLYRSICEMAISTSEQMRSIRSLASSNEKMQSGLIITMADMVENRDSDTGAHIQKTAAYVSIILEGLKRKGYYAEKLTDKYINDVIMSAPLHDIGKINVPDAVLNKPGKLTPEEYEIIKTHTTAGKKILENAISTVEGENYLKEARNMAAYHHERWDGKGYPEGLHGQVIPLSARVMAVADVFDALASARVYKPAFPFEKAISIIKEGAGTQFDPKCVEVFMDNLSEVKKVLKKYQDTDEIN